MVQGGFRGDGRARREEGGFKVQVRMGGCGFSRSGGGGGGYVIDGSGNGVRTIWGWEEWEWVVYGGQAVLEGVERLAFEKRWNVSAMEVLCLCVLHGSSG